MAGSPPYGLQLSDAAADQNAIWRLQDWRQALEPLIGPPIPPTGAGVRAALLALAAQGFVDFIVYESVDALEAAQPASAQNVGEFGLVEGGTWASGDVPEVVRLALSVQTGPATFQWFITTISWGVVTTLADVGTLPAAAAGDLAYGPQLGATYVGVVDPATLDNPFSALGVGYARSNYPGTGVFLIAPPIASGAGYQSQLNTVGTIADATPQTQGYAATIGGVQGVDVDWTYDAGAGLARVEQLAAGPNAYSRGANSDAPNTQVWARNISFASAVGGARLTVQHDASEGGNARTIGARAEVGVPNWFVDTGNGAFVDSGLPFLDGGSVEVHFSVIAGTVAVVDQTGTVATFAATLGGALGGPAGTFDVSTTVVGESILIGAIGGAKGPETTL